MRRTRRLVLTLATILALVVGLAAPAEAAGIHYVALGDSYSSGVGAGSYISSSGSCDRSTKAYPYLWSAAHSPASFTFAACSGAKTSDVLSSQVSSVTSSTTLVSITIGGNDENFSSIMEDCNLHGDSTCVNEINSAEADARANLPGKLANVYAAVKSRAPSAEIVVLDYPHFYDLSNDCIGLSQTKRTKIDEGIDVLDGILKTSAGKAGAHFADARGAFNGHVICDSNRWLHSINFTDITESYHPTATGHSSGYLPTFTAGV